MVFLGKIHSAWSSPAILLVIKIPVKMFSEQLKTIKTTKLNVEFSTPKRNMLYIRKNKIIL
jgi:hypothetical protein